MKLKPLAIAAIALLLPLSACGTGGDTEPAESSVSSPAAPADDQPTGVPQVDRDPQGDLPAIAFDDKSIPTMEPIDGEAPTQITVKTLKQGDGETVGEGAFVTVNYAGFLWSDGTQFDSSYDRGTPSSFSLDQVVDGWKYGLAGTKVGDQVQIVVPPAFGYGDQESETIPANSTLVFVVDVLDATTVDAELLTQATPTDEKLPEGLTVTGDLGAQPGIDFAADAEAPAEPQVIVLAEGTGEPITETDTVAYHVTGGEWGGETMTTWTDTFQQVPNGGGTELIGKKAGSRVLLTYPADTEAGTNAQVLVIDVMAAIPAG